MSAAERERFGRMDRRKENRDREWGASKPSKRYNSLTALDSAALNKIPSATIIVVFCLARTCATLLDPSAHNLASPGSSRRFLIYIGRLNSKCEHIMQTQKYVAFNSTINELLTLALQQKV